MEGRNADSWADIDYKELLKRYIKHVAESKGSTFINTNQHFHILNDEDIKELVNLENELCDCLEFESCDKCKKMGQL